MIDSDEFRHSPLALVFGEGREIRARMDGPEAKRFPLFDDLRK
jgi:adenylate cyclase